MPLGTNEVMRGGQVRDIDGRVVNTSGSVGGVLLNDVSIAALAQSAWFNVDTTGYQRIWVVGSVAGGATAVGDVDVYSGMFEPDGTTVIGAGLSAPSELNWAALTASTAAMGRGFVIRGMTKMRFAVRNNHATLALTGRLIYFAQR